MISKQGKRHVQITQILSGRCPAQQLFRGSGGKLHLPVRHLPAGAGVGAGTGLSTAGTQKPQLYPDARRAILLSKKSDSDGGL